MNLVVNEAVSHRDITVTGRRRAIHPVVLKLKYKFTWAHESCSLIVNPQCKRGQTEKHEVATSEKGASLTDWKWQKWRPRAQQHGSWPNTVCGVMMETPQVHVRAFWTVLRLSQGLLGCYWIGNMPVWWNNLPRKRKRPTRYISFLRLWKYKTKWKPKSLVAKSRMQSLRADGWPEY